jgi:hypothetical protein
VLMHVRCLASCLQLVRCGSSSSSISNPLQLSNDSAVALQPSRSVHSLLFALLLFGTCFEWHRLVAKQVTALQLGSSLVRYDLHFTLCLSFGATLHTAAC